MSEAFARLSGIAIQLPCNSGHGDREPLRDQVCVNGEHFREMCAESLQVSARNVGVLT